MTTRLLVSHPKLDTSRANRALYEAVRTLSGVDACHLEARYPSRVVDVAEEQSRLLVADRLVLQFPFFWYSAPPALKQWLDDVLTFGWAYGPGGTKLSGKHLQLVVTAGGPESAYRKDGYNHYTVAELLRPFEATAHLTGMLFSTPLVLYDAPNIPGLPAPPVSEDALASFAKHYREVLITPVRRR